MNKEYVLEKLAEEVGEYIGKGPHPVVAVKGHLNKASKQRENARLLIKAHKKYMDKTGKPISMAEFTKAIEAGEIANPLKAGLLARHGKAALMIGGGALAGAAGLSLLAASQQPPQPDPTQMYVTP